MSDFGPFYCTTYNQQRARRRMCDVVQALRLSLTNKLEPNCVLYCFDYKDSTTTSGPYNSEKTSTMLENPSQSDIALYSNTTPPASEAHSNQPFLQRNKATAAQRGMTESSQRTTGGRTGSTSQPGESSPRPSAFSRQMSHIRRVTTQMFVPPRPVGEPPGPLQSARAILTASCTLKPFFS